MRFHVLLPVRDEADLLAQCLESLLGWADAIYVFDSGSVDESWEIARDFAQKDSRVKACWNDSVYFSETRLRGWMFAQARQFMRAGDWFLRADVDEFHHVRPPDFVNSAMRRWETVAYHQYYDFKLTQSEAEAWKEGRETLRDRERPIAERRRRFMLTEYSEPRLCRYRDTMAWPPTVSFPFNAGFVARERLPIRHYPHRDPMQLQRRCRLRAAMMANVENRSNWSHPKLHHWAERDWRNFLVPDDLPGLQSWLPGTELPRPQFTNHLKHPAIRCIQRIAHAGLLPLLDRFRSGWPSEAYPQKIPADIVARLKEELVV